MKTLLSIFTSIFIIFISLQYILSYSLSENKYNEIFLNDENPYDSVEPPDIPSLAGNGLTDVANMYNERGFYGSNGFSNIEQEIINDFNGNLMYQIPLYNYKLAGDLNFNLSLNYNGSVGEQYFVGTVNTYQALKAERFNVNAPEWIFNLNGIGIQTLNLESSFFTNKVSVNQIKGDSTNTLIPGYHYDGSLMAATQTSPNRIQILAGDGSIISLIRVSTATHSDSLYIGNYVSEGKESYYKANVNYIEDGFSGYRRRIVKLLKGDGTVFQFKEYKRSFYDFSVDDNVDVRRRPMMLLLDEMKDNFGHFVKLYYATENVSGFNAKGRPFLDSITAYGYSKENIKIKFAFSVGNVYVYSETGISEVYKISYNTTPISFSESGNQKGYVTQIENPITQKAYVTYENYTRNFDNIQASQINSGDPMSVIFNKCKRIKNYRSFLNGRFDYKYNVYGETTNLHVSNIGLVNNRLRSSVPLYKGNGRDPFYVNMIATKEDSNNLIPKSKASFYYDFNDYNTSYDKIDSMDKFIATKTIESKDPSTLNSSKDMVSVYRLYRTYPLFNDLNIYLGASDIQGITKLVYDSSFYPSETPSTSNFDKNKYKYEVGQANPDDTTFNGSFLILQTLNVRENQSRVWNVNYKYLPGPDYDEPVLAKFQIDPLLNRDSTIYLNLYQSNLIHRRMSNYLNSLEYDTTIFYKIGLLKEQKKYDQNLNLLSRNALDYFTITNDNNGYYGQLKSTKKYSNFSPSTYLESTYEYYKNDTSGRSIYTGDFYPFKEGNIKQISNPNNQETKFFYTPISESEVIQSSGQNPKLKYKIKRNDGSIIQTSSDIWDTRLPIRTDRYRNNGNYKDSLSKIYSSYEVNGDPNKFINENKFLTQVKYDTMYRVNSIILPDDFSIIDTTSTIDYQYDNTFNTATIINYRKTYSSNVEYSKIRYLFDGFGNVNEKDVFTSDANYNAYTSRFNYLNLLARIFLPTGDSTMYSYDGIKRNTKNKNADLSITINSYSYQNQLNYYFDTTYYGFVEKLNYTDEENNNFEKYYDAIGNLLQEVSYVVQHPSDASTLTLRTSYKYDSLYRLIKVQTPANKKIYYVYDQYGRQSKRTTVDAGLTDYIYDITNNMTYSQDVNQRNVHTNKYTFKNYDGINRITGVGEAIFQIDSPFDGTQYVPTDSTLYLTINVYDTLSSAIVPFFNGVAGFNSTTYSKGNLIATAYRTRSTDAFNFKYYHYDERGRIVRMWNVLSGFDTVETIYQYNSQNQIIKYAHYKDGDSKTFLYEYDYAGRLKQTDYYVGWPDTPDPSIINFAEYKYNANSQVSDQDFFGIIKNSHHYNNRGWITAFQNNVSMFEYSNTYFLNGNVKTQSLSGDYNNNFLYNNDLNYIYAYDRTNRLLDQNISGVRSCRILNTFDEDGNLLTMKRYGITSALLDNFSYSYYSNTNKLKKVSGSNDQFNYDGNGNLITDSLNRNTEIKYDNRNLILEIRNKQFIEFDSLITKLLFDYDEAGNRIRKRIYFLDNSSSETPNPWILQHDYIYSRGSDGKELAIYDNGVPKQWNIFGLGNEGYLDINDTMYYYFKDHLGSVRATVNQNNVLKNSQDYDAWGYLIQNRYYESNTVMYKYTSKERDKESTYDYFGVRYYDSRVGRWGQNDPIFDSEPSLNPYHYTADNPINFIDPNGMDYIFYIPGSGPDGIRYPHPGEDEYYFYSISGNYVADATGDYSFLNGLTFYKANDRATKDYFFKYNFYYTSNEIEYDFEYNEAISLLQRQILKVGSIFPPFDIFYESWSEHDFDYKQFLSNHKLYLFGGILYNKEEAGNIIWAMTLAYYNIFDKFDAMIGAQVYTIWKRNEFDEWNEQIAIYRGYSYFHENSIRKLLP